MSNIYELDADQLAERVLGHVGMSTWPPVHEAIRLARTAHGDQVRKDGSPFVEHPLRTALIMIEEAEVKNADEICAALLHDVVEDTTVEIDEIEEGFGPRVADFVRALTHPPLKVGESKFERNVRHFKTIAWEERPARIIKSADRLDNLRTMGRREQWSPVERATEYLQETREGLIPITLACHTALYHALLEACDQAETGL